MSAEAAVTPEVEQPEMNVSELVKKYMTRVLSNKRNIAGNGIEYPLPFITSIDTIPVAVSLKVHNANFYIKVEYFGDCIHTTLEGQSLYQSESQKVTGDTCEKQLELFLPECFSQLNSLTFSNLKGKFVDDTKFAADCATLEVAKKLVKATNPYPSKEPRISCDGPACPVCYKCTESVTECGHSLCLNCACQIKGSKNKKKCPLCRSPLVWGYKDYDEDDDESEDE